MKSAGRNSGRSRQLSVNQLSVVSFRQNGRCYEKLRTEHAIVMKKPRTEQVIASQCSHWRGNPPVFPASHAGAFSFIVA